MTSSASFQPRVVLGASLIVWPSSLPLLVLPLGLVGQGLLDGAEAVQVLDLDDRRGDRLAVLRDVEVDVGVAAERAFLHLAVGDVQVAQGQPQLLQAAAASAGVRISGSVTISSSGMPARFRSTSEKPPVAVRQLAGVFLEVDPRQPAPAAAAAVLPDRDLEPPALAKTAGRTG